MSPAAFFLSTFFSSLLFVLSAHLLSSAISRVFLSLLPFSSLGVVFAYLISSCCVLDLTSCFILFSSALFLCFSCGFCLYLVLRCCVLLLCLSFIPHLYDMDSCSLSLILFLLILSMFTCVVLCCIVATDYARPLREEFLLLSRGY